MVISSAQQHDRYWILGYDYNPELMDTTFGATYFDFNEEPVRMYYNPDHSLNMTECASLISDSLGNLEFYTNGMQIQNAEHEIVPGGDTIAYGAKGDFWERWILNEGQMMGYPFPQGAITLPVPDKTGQYILLYTTADIYVKLPQVSHLFSAYIDMTEGPGTILYKDSVMIQDSLSWGQLSACKHANGRDWWIVTPERKGNGYYILLLSPEGLSDPIFQSTGDNPSTGYGVGQAGFTSNGSMYYRFEGSSHTETGGLMNIYHFDRCTGQLSNHRWWNMPHYSISGAAISLNGRYLYATDVFNLWQYDLQAEDIEASRITVAEWDGYVEPGWFETFFSMMALGPDGRIYVIPPTGGSMVMHVIDRPNKRDTACRVLQHHIKLPTWNARTLPNYPNFRLGPLDGSGCDTLGLDNIPVAQFRHEIEDDDAAEIHFTDLSYYGPVEWEWDFGDGTIATGTEQIHTYSKTGTYDVCLTVSNPYGTNTTCQKVFAEKASAVSEFRFEETLHLYPNPFSDYVDIDPKKQEDFNIIITDVNGREAIHVEMTCPCRIRLSHLPAGIYFYQIEQGSKVHTGKLVKTQN